MGLIPKKEKRVSSTSPCSDLKEAYQQCFNKWYTEKFVKGDWAQDDCVNQWRKYRACLSEHLDEKLLARFSEFEIIPPKT